MRWFKIGELRLKGSALLGCQCIYIFTKRPKSPSAPRRNEGHLPRKITPASRKIIGAWKSDSPPLSTENSPPCLSVAQRTPLITCGIDWLKWAPKQWPARTDRTSEIREWNWKPILLFRHSHRKCSYALHVEIIAMAGRYLYNEWWMIKFRYFSGPPLRSGVWRFV